MTKFTRVLALLGALAVMPATASAECPEPTDTSGVDVVQGVYSVSAQVEITPYMWVSNAGEDTVSKIDTKLNKEIARYRTDFWGGPGTPWWIHNAWQGPAPSRSAVDTAGNAYIANRAFTHHGWKQQSDGSWKNYTYAGYASVMKIMPQGCGPDRNNNGKCDTSSDLNNDGKITPDEMYAIKDLNGNGLIEHNEIFDERILWVRRVGGLDEVARALAIDKDGDLWVGMYNTKRIYKMSGDTGAVLGGPWDLGVHPYGAAVDSKGQLFTAGLGRTWGTRMNTANPAQKSNYWIEYGYGLAVGTDHTGKEWVATANHASRGFQLTDPTTLATSWPINTGYSAYGISFDLDGHLVFSSGYNQSTRGATKARTDGSIIWTRGPKSGCTSGAQRGALVDSTNNIWVVSVSDHKVCKYLADGTVDALVPVGRYPYTYSDASGIGLQYSDPTGTITFISDADQDGFDWSGDDLCFAGSGDVTVKVAAAASQELLGEGVAMPVTENNGQLCGTVPNGVVGQFLQISFIIKAGGAVVIQDDGNGCSIEIPEANEAPIAMCIADLTLSADGQCQAAAPGIDNGSNDPDGAADIASLGQTPVAGSSLGLGSHTIGLSIADLAGESATCQTVVTVVDDSAPSADAGDDQGGLVADAQCSYSVTSAGSGADNCGVASTTWTDAAGNAVGTTTDFAGSFSNIGSYTYTLTVCDNAGACTADDVTFSVVDQTKPTLDCGLAAAGYTPKSWDDGAVSISGSAQDNCDAGSVLTISDYSVTKNGKSKTDNADASWSAGDLTIGDSVGVNATHSWTLTATDASGNADSIQCSFTIANPGQGGGSGGGSGCNNGFGNGSEGCSPDNGAHHDQDETGAGNGKGNGKGKK